MAILDIDCTLASSSTGQTRLMQMHSIPTSISTNTSGSTKLTRTYTNVASSMIAYGEVTAVPTRLLNTSYDDTSTSDMTEGIVRVSYVSCNISVISELAAKPIRLRYSKPVLNGKGTITIGEVDKFNTISTNITVKTSMEVYRYDRDILSSLKSYLSFIKDSDVFNALLKSQGIEVTRFFALLDELEDNFFIDSTNVEGICLWEKDFGIQASDKTLSQVNVDNKLNQGCASLRFLQGSVSSRY
ncbi:hypothetical protein [Paenibacillus sp. NPDC093718]|uniref:hypothetical protein n=1 Tax=Paenibacillus sp. NPDC093718 TaxID=3390601 RepID=UPI003D083A33